MQITRFLGVAIVTGTGLGLMILCMVFLLLGAGVGGTGVCVGVGAVTVFIATGRMKSYAATYKYTMVDCLSRGIKEGFRNKKVCRDMYKERFPLL